MDDTTKTLFGFLFAAMTGMYAFFIKHVVGHVNTDAIKSNTDDIYRLYDCKQSKERCEEIVKRIDENHQETCRKLDRILNKLESV